MLSYQLGLQIFEDYWITMPCPVARHMLKFRVVQSQAGQTMSCKGDNCVIYISSIAISGPGEGRKLW